MSTQYGVRLQGAEEAWVAAQVAAGKTAREAIEGAIRTASGAPSAERRTLHVAGRDRRRRLRDHLARVVRQERQRAGRVQRELTLAMTALAKARLERGDQIAENARLRAELAAATTARQAAEARERALLHRDAADQQTRERDMAQVLRTLGEVVYPGMAALRQDIDRLGKGAWAQVNQIADTARDLQQSKDARDMENALLDGYVAGRMAERAGAPLPPAVRGRLAATEPSHVLLQPAKSNRSWSSGPRAPTRHRW